MIEFFAAQARDPFDHAPMLIHADWLEEHGDATGAAVLRALVGAGRRAVAGGVERRRRGQVGSIRAEASIGIRRADGMGIRPDERWGRLRRFV